MHLFNRFQGTGNLELVQHLRRSGVIKSEKVFDTMCQVDRGNFINSNDAYIDSPLSIGCGATISAPHMHGYVLEYLLENLREGGKALDVGSGSGYLTTCMALLLGPSGTAIGIEHIHELQENAKLNIVKDHSELLNNGRIKLVGDGRLGYEPKAPYDAIHVGAVAEVAPKNLINQLAHGGRMIVPIGNGSSDQTLFQIDKGFDGNVRTTPLMGVVYVPLTDKEKQLKK